MGLTTSQMEDALGYPLTLEFPPAPALAYLAASRAIPLYLAQPGGVIARQFDALAEHIAEHLPA
jgi:hypothetical protein